MRRKNARFFYFINSIIHAELTRERSIWFLLFKIKRVFVYYSTIFTLTICLSYAFSFEMYMPTKKLFKKKGYSNMYKGSKCDRKSQLSEILTELLTQRVLLWNKALCSYKNGWHFWENPWVYVGRHRLKIIVIFFPK